MYTFFFLKSNTLKLSVCDLTNNLNKCELEVAQKIAAVVKTLNTNCPNKCDGSGSDDIDLKILLDSIAYNNTIADILCAVLKFLQALLGVDGLLDVDLLNGLVVNLKNLLGKVLSIDVADILSGNLGDILDGVLGQIVPDIGDVECPDIGDVGGPVDCPDVDAPALPL